MLTPNATYTMNGVSVKEKIIPDGTVWKDDAKSKKAGFRGAGAPYKRNEKLSKNTGKVQYVTIHNTDDLANADDDGELYTRATYNENMGSVRVHFYVDDVCAWQNLKAGTGLCVNDPIGSAEVSWHSGDGVVPDGGNMTSISMEVIMNDSAVHDAKAKDNAARIAAWLLWKNGLPISKLVTHTYWVNKSAGKTFADVDVQCTNPIKNQKWCPAYIFDSNNPTVALQNWKAFKDLVSKYIGQLNHDTAITAQVIKVTPTVEIKVGDLIKITGTKYYNGKTIPSLIKAQKWYVASVNGDRVVLNKSENGRFSINSAINIADITKYNDVIEVGDKVKCNDGVNTYSNGKVMASWIPTAELYVRAIEQNGKILLVSTERTTPVYTGRVNVSDVHKV